ncbi:MAG: haloalkane dehalogenase [Rhodoferax sp.]|jgi:haloalkane dehalogenase|nr:haloalkane dehalogenase [Rhodoferax sp.]
MYKLPIIHDILRTPEECFADLPDFPWTPRYTQVAELRIACIDEGPRDAPVVLLMHGEPAWSFLYRKMIPILLAAGLRVVAPDLVGFGRSDKPARSRDYSYLNHVLWMRAWLEQLDLQHITLFCQDWGSLIGLRLAAEMPGRFDRIVLANGGLPTGMEKVPRAFRIWRAFARYSPWFPIGRIVQAGCVHGLSPRERAAYDAPFPTRRYTRAARLFPGFVPTSPRDPERTRNEQAWAVFRTWQKPFLTLFSNRDPITRGGHRIWHQRVPGAQGQPHAVTRNAGHFLQEDKGPEVAAAIVVFIESTPLP